MWYFYCRDSIKGNTRKLIMGFPHCPICIVLAFLSFFMGVTRGYMSYILFKEFARDNQSLNSSFAWIKSWLLSINTL